MDDRAEIRRGIERKQTPRASMVSIETGVTEVEHTDRGRHVDYEPGQRILIL